MNQQKTTFDPSQLNQNNFINYLIQNSLQNITTTYPAKIISVSNLRATVQPIINNVGAGQESPDPFPVYDVPIAQLVGGNAGIIIEYKPNDVVMCGVIQRDISSIKQNWQQANPVSNRIMNYADSIILFKLSNTLPTTYVKITNDGIVIHSEHNVNVSCTNAQVNASSVTINGDTTINGQVTLGGSGGASVITMNSVIKTPTGQICTVTNPAQKVTAL